MRNRLKRRIRIYALSALEILLWALVLIVGPFPGLGEIPLFRATLASLAINYALNALGILLLLLVPIIGPLPGPGGIPLLRAALAILAINNPWAKNIERYIDHKAERLSDLLFWENKKCQWAWDIFIVVSIGASIYIALYVEMHWFWQLVVSGVSGILVIFWFYNRQRWQRLLRYWKITSKPKEKQRLKPMQAITLYQPWASLIACGAKTTETRSWRPPSKLIGQEIAIHAAKQPMKNLESTLAQAAARKLGGTWPNNLPSGAIVATAKLVSAEQIKRLNDIPKGDEKLFGDYSLGRWMWQLSDIRPLKQPIATRGRQGFWIWQPDD